MLGLSLRPSEVNEPDEMKDAQGGDHEQQHEQQQQQEQQEQERLQREGDVKQDNQPKEPQEQGHQQRGHDQDQSPGEVGHGLRTQDELMMMSTETNPGDFQSKSSALGVMGPSPALRLQSKSPALGVMGLRSHVADERDLDDPEFEEIKTIWSAAMSAMSSRNLAAFAKSFQEIAVPEWSK